MSQSEPETKVPSDISKTGVAEPSHSGKRPKCHYEVGATYDYECMHTHCPDCGSHATTTQLKPTVVYRLDCEGKHQATIYGTLLPKTPQTPPEEVEVDD